MAEKDLAGDLFVGYHEGERRKHSRQQKRGVIREMHRDQLDFRDFFSNAVQMVIWECHQSVPMK